MSELTPAAALRRVVDQADDTVQGRRAKILAKALDLAALRLHEHRLIASEQAAWDALIEAARVGEEP